MDTKRVIRALLIDDDAATRLLHRSFLETLDWVEICGEAADGIEGRAQIDALQPDLVLLDLVMPGCNGTALMLALQEDPPPVMPKIIVISCQCCSEMVNFAMHLGAVSFLGKPVRFGELAGLIQHCFDRAEPSGLLEPAVIRARCLLAQMGADQDSLGCCYAALAAGELAGDSALLLKEAYAPAIRLGHTCRANVEKNIRDLIARVHALATPCYCAVMGGLPELRPDNRTFLRRLARAAAQPASRGREG